MNNLIQGDCLEEMKGIPEGSIDMILCDPPYGTTKCKWDSVIDPHKLWEQYNRIIKPNGVIVLTASQPFTSVLITSNLKDFKYTLVWEKSKATGYLNAKKQPMRAHEDICVFYRGKPTYNPQKLPGFPYNKGTAHRPTEVYGKQITTTVLNKTGLRYPRSVLYFKTAESEGKVFHPTQKPVKLFQYLIKTFTNPEDIVLDNCIGVGTTGIAAKLENRRFIGIEINKKFINIANKRINEA